MNSAHNTINDCILHPFSVDANSLDHESAVEFGADRCSAIVLLCDAMQYANFAQLDYADSFFPEYRTTLMGFISRLLKVGANVNAIDYDGRSPLLVAAAHNDADLARLLVEAGADPWRENAQGKSPVRVAEVNHFDAVVAYFHSVRMTQSLPPDSPGAGIDGYTNL